MWEYEGGCVEAAIVVEVGSGGGRWSVGRVGEGGREVGEGGRDGAVGPEAD